MKIKKHTILTLLLSLFLILPIPIQSYAKVIDRQYIYDIIQIAEEKYVEEISREEYIENAIKGVFENLDDYSRYYNSEEFEELTKDVNGNLVGIGVYIAEQDGYILILDAIDNSPAKEAGLVSGDIIMGISGRSTYGITSKQAVDLIKGEEGTTVLLNIKRNNEKFSVILKRTNVEIHPIKYEIKDNIGYIKLEQFSQNSYDHIMEALDYMDENSMKDIILDLRDNPGGYLDQAIQIGNQFVKKGPITHIKYRNQDPITHNSYLKEIKYNLVILVNENSASASELLAAAIKDTKSGKVIGTKTFGKGTVQEIIPLERGDGIKLTRAEYFSPNMSKIQGVGVTPNIEVINRNGKDNQLEKAMDIFTKP